MRKGLFFDNSAVSPIIGFVLILAILVTTLTFMQQHFVPVWNSQVELDHFEKVYADLTRFTSTTQSVAVTGSPMTADINMGLKFPGRAIFFNPRPTVFGRLTTDNLAVSIDYTTTDGTVTKYYDSSTMIFELDGITPHPRLVYEHGILIKDYSAYGLPNITASKLPFFSDSEEIIYVYILMTNTSRKTDISVIPIQKNIMFSSSDRVTYLADSKVNVVLETHYPDVWRHLIPTELKNNTDIYIDNNTIKIRSAIITQLDLPKNRTDMLMQSDRLYSGLVKMEFNAGI